jgi:outer membrane protein OmpA-like peptidoglycan-associated protein
MQRKFFINSFTAIIANLLFAISHLSYGYVAEGYVYNEDSNVKIPNANLLIINAGDKETIKIQTDAEGKFTVELQPNKIYEIHTSHPKFLSAEVIELRTVDYKKIYSLSIPLKEVHLGKALLIEKVNFEINDTTFTKKTYPALEKFYQVLQDNQTFKVEIAVHTDSRGNDEYNLELSQKRADYIVNYLISKGIQSNKVTGKGYGETHLVNGCANGVRCNGTDHEQNRRVEFVVTGFLE